MQTEKEYLSGRDICALRCESVGEYTLPDYNGDVKKVLAVKTKIFPAGKFVGDDSLEFSGSVGYDIVYVDGENMVTHAEFSTDYDGAVRINSQTYVDSDVRTSVASCSMRLIGPRKLSVKCSLDNDVRITEKKTYEILGDAFDEYEPELSTKTVSVFAQFFGVGEAKEVNEEILNIDGAIADEVEILLTDAEFILDSLERSDDEVEVKGSVRVTLLYRNGDETPRIAVKEIPIDEDIDAEGVMSLESLDARAEITSLKSRVDPTEDGVSLNVTFTVLPEVYGVKNTDLEVVCDAYLRERGTENDYSEFGYTEHLCTEMTEERFDVKASLSELGIENTGDVIWSESSARVENCEIEDDGVKISGEIRFSGIACQVSEEQGHSYFPIKFTLPFIQNVNSSCQKHDNMHANCSVSTSDTKIEFDENSAHASCTLSTAVTLSSQRRQRCLGSSYLTDEEYSRDESIVTVYYPDSSETLFGIAKKFHTSVSSIAENNRLAQSVFASSEEPLGVTEVKKLLIK